MVNIDNESLYRKCRKKLYDAHVCIPPEGTFIVNKLEEPAIVSFLKGKTFLTNSELKSLDKETLTTLENLLKAGNAQVVTKGTCVIAGTLGELKVIGLNELMNMYQFVTSNGTLAIGLSSVQSRMKDGYLPWTLIRAKQDNRVYHACFVSKHERVESNSMQGSALVARMSSQGMPKGRGYFVVAPDAYGKPDFNNRVVLHGEVFARMFNNHGWNECIDNPSKIEVVTIASLPNLITTGVNSTLVSSNGKLRMGKNYASAFRTLREHIAFFSGTIDPKEVLEKLNSLMTNKIFLANNKYPANENGSIMMCELVNKLLWAMHKAQKKLEAHDMKFDFDRVFDVVVTETDTSGDIGLSYGFTYMNTSLFGFASIGKGGVLLCTWKGSNKVPFEEFVERPNLNGDSIVDHFNRALSGNTKDCLSSSELKELLDGLSTNIADIEFTTEVDDNGTVWISPTNEVRWLYSKFYFGVTKSSNDRFIAEARCIFGDSYDYEKEASSISSVVSYFTNFLNFARESYGALIALCKKMMDTFGSRSYKEEMNMNNNLWEDGEYAGFWIGLSNMLAEKMRLANKDSAYLGVRYDIDKPTKDNCSKPTVSYSIWTQGDGVDDLLSVTHNTVKGAYDEFARAVNSL